MFWFYTKQTEYTRGKKKMPITLNISRKKTVSRVMLSDDHLTLKPKVRFSPQWTCKITNLLLKALA